MLQTLTDWRIKILGRHTHTSIYKELLVSRDFWKWVLGTLPIGLGLIGGPADLGLPRIPGFPLDLGSLCFLLSLGINGLPIIWGAIQGIRCREINVDELVSLALIACVATGEFLEAAIVSAIMVAGSLVEELVSQGARNSIRDLVDSSPKTVQVLGEDGGEATVELSSVRPGDRLSIRPGQTIGVDGLILQGRGSINEASLTGEFLPVDRKEGEEVSSGTVNLDGHLIVQARRRAEDSTLGRIIALVQAAENSKVAGSRLVDRFARWFTPTILVLAGLAWVLSGRLEQGITVLIVGCPCSFLLSGPVPTVAAIGRAAKAGILVKGGMALEALAESKTWFFDKTGTLTEGWPVLGDIQTLDGLDHDSALAQAAAVETGSEHPLGKALVSHVRARGLFIPQAREIRAQAGVGISGRVGGALVELHGEDPGADSSHTTVVMELDSRPVLRLVFHDQVRKDAAWALDQLRAQGAGQTVLLSGDQAQPVHTLARSLDIDQAFYRQSPEDKLTRIQAASNRGVTVFVGDGLNDAPALTAADVGIAMGRAGVDAALETADIVLLEDSIGRLPFLHRLARRMKRTIWINVALSFGLNALAVVLAFLGLLSPILGAISHNIGSIAVVLISASIGLMSTREQG